jgi:hypothetical protein
MGLLKKTKRGAGTQHMGAVTFHRPRRSGGPIYVDDRFSPSIFTWMTEFSVTRMMCSCVTIGFCQSVYL